MTTILLISSIILIVICFVLRILLELIIPDAPTPPQKSEEVATEPPSVIGVSKNVMLTPPPPKSEREKPSPRVPDEQLDDTFTNNIVDDFEDEPPEIEYDEDMSEEEQREVVNTDNDTATEHIEEDKQILKGGCIDYYQIEDVANKLSKQLPLNIDDANTLDILEGTDIISQILKANALNQEKVAEMLARVTIK